MSEGRKDIRTSDHELPRRSMKRTALSLLLIVLLGGCAGSPKPYVAPVDQPLQEPVPGKALIYLLRAPYDDQQLEITLSGRKVAVLPGSSYTAVSMPPGIHVLRTQSSGLFSSGVEAAQPFELDLKANERRFFNVSGVTARTAGLAGVIPLSRGAGAPLLLPQTGTVANTRTWKEVTELDAQGLMSISRLVLPEKDAL
jgi:hypothetical protein